MDQDSPFTINLTPLRIVRIFAILVLVVTGYQILSGVLAIGLLLLLTPGTDLARIVPPIPPLGGSHAGIQAWILAHLPLAIAIQFLLTLVTLCAAVGLLLRRRWAALYFIAVLALVGATAAASLWLDGAALFAATPVPIGAGANLAAAMRAFSTMWAAGPGKVLTAIIFVCLLLIGALRSPGVIADGREAGRRSTFDSPRAPSTLSVTLSVLGLIVPLLGLAGLAFGYLAWLRVQNEEDSSRRTAAIIGMLIGALGGARDAYVAISLLLR